VDHGPEKGKTTFTPFNFKYAIRIPVLNPVIVSVLPAKTFTLSKIRVTRADHYVCQCSVDANSGVITGVSDDLFGVNTSDGDCDVDYLGQSSKGYLNLKYENPATLYVDYGVALRRYKEQQVQHVDDRVLLECRWLKLFKILGVAWYKGNLLKGKFCFIQGDDYISTSGEALAL
ncbi:hypothetical protein Tco_0679619, partial [Tanacetum coccineum]